MSIWSDNPEWFDEWIEERALDGKFGSVIQGRVERGELAGYELWAMHDLDPRGELGTWATEDYMTRWER
jgi:hypothetical protein